MHHGKRDPAPAYQKATGHAAAAIRAGMGQLVSDSNSKR
ncbi:hypothetical protein CT19425_U500008 [Cupriavidus taiwanensis]|uniref:Uncharacterized protein n=1 Tax=Cupriavidus taiwanensis TaxID=164546 RepID=A0A375IA36_9BURK|nr:hypothetical protein CBM2592_B150058 [Cupriavidus taiwanensis]SOY67156.1 hypothetical protein CBM2588_B190060 [Cupriavidus taiwanensis]SOY68846.1 hypothetical protein CBM2589_A90316 [Cupriavidus taiwanensis]SOY94813.1 hypothetical protein CBM2591_B140059 [Cupriavidus taiwanensis]SOZ28159.1 hypothetical protein CBM2608_B140059 [Cupriavidus taiwanensis]